MKIVKNSHWQHTKKGLVGRRDAALIGLMYFNDNVVINLFGIISFRSRLEVFAQCGRVL